MGTGTAGREASAMSAHAATHKDLFEADARALRASIDLRKAALVGAVAVAVVTALVVALPGAYSAVSAAVAKLGHADWRWLALALGLEALSFFGHIVLFRAVFLDESSHIGYGASYDVTLAGHAATRRRRRANANAPGIVGAQQEKSR